MLCGSHPRAILLGSYLSLFTHLFKRIVRKRSFLNRAQNTREHSVLVFKTTNIVVFEVNTFFFLLLIAWENGILYNYPSLQKQPC